ncbi:MAG: hypothetical protein A2V63_12930 [Candidatus Eisenbacteria bacterium RBG_19FT_COMBO_70_11]|nr:MAG: hypothetical protein A2V63_12930 [Candidatus Eisenbacteria bacterium RBG_19FT_COMBO_70_11]
MIVQVNDGDIEDLLRWWDLHGPRPASTAAGDVRRQANSRFPRLAAMARQAFRSSALITVVVRRFRRLIEDQRGRLASRFGRVPPAEAAETSLAGPLDPRLDLILDNMMGRIEAAGKPVILV